MNLKLPHRRQAGPAHRAGATSAPWKSARRELLMLDRRRLTLDQIEAALVRRFPGNPNLVVYIRARRELPLEQIVEAVIDRCQRNGITRFSAPHRTARNADEPAAKKCFVASTGFHLLLVVILVVGPAFLASKSKADDSPILDVIPTKLIDEAFSGGGNPNGTPPPPAPPSRAADRRRPPTPHARAGKAAAARAAAEPVKEVKPDPPDPNAVEPDTQTASAGRQHKPVIRRPDHRQDRQVARATTSDGRHRAASECQRTSGRRRVGASARSLRERSLPRHQRRDALGPAAAARSMPITTRWCAGFTGMPGFRRRTPPAMPPSPRASVTIASDGTVLSATHHSALGRCRCGSHPSRRRCDRVTFVAPFPEGAKEKQRTFTIKFDLQSQTINRMKQPTLSSQD